MWLRPTAWASAGLWLLALGCAGGAMKPAGPRATPDDGATESGPGEAEATAPNSSGRALPSTQPTTISEAVSLAVSAPDREPADLALDAGRHPAETLAFFRIAPGMRVAELGAGAGYTAELLARVVGPEGTVFAQNPPFVLERFAEEPWSARLTKAVMKPVVRVDREFSDPLPPEATDLDAVLIVLFYHDTVWQHADRAAMNRAVFHALRPGGVYGIVDHAAREGAGTTETETLHRIEEATLRAEVERAGFQLEAEARFLRNPADTKDWNAAPRAAGQRRGTSDRFVLRFIKPPG